MLSLLLSCGTNANVCCTSHFCGCTEDNVYPLVRSCPLVFRQLPISCIGRIQPTDTGKVCSKYTEFALWASEAKKLDIEVLPKQEERELFRTFREDFNTATLPHRKYYNLQEYQRRKAEKAARQGSSDVSARLPQSRCFLAFLVDVSSGQWVLLSSKDAVPSSRARNVLLPFQKEKHMATG